MYIDISNLDPSGVLAALTNAAEPVNPLAANSWRRLTPDAAERILASREQVMNNDREFRMLYGRRLHIALTGDVLDTTEYDRINGDGRGAAAINYYRLTGLVTLPPSNPSTDDAINFMWSALYGATA